MLKYVLTSVLILCASICAAQCSSCNGWTSSPSYYYYTQPSYQSPQSVDNTQWLYQNGNWWYNSNGAWQFWGHKEKTFPSPNQPEPASSSAKDLPAIMDIPPIPNGYKGATDNQNAWFVLHCAPDAVVWIDGKPTSLAGEVRTYGMLLAEGTTYRSTITVKLKSGTIYSRTLRILAGQTIDVW